MKQIDDKDCVVAFGEFVRNGRDRRGWYQHEAAHAIGISQGYYCRIERGERETPLSLALNICAVLNLDINDFVAQLK